MEYKVFFLLIISLIYVNGKINFNEIIEATLKTNINEINITEEIEKEYTINETEIYKFVIKNENYLYSFTSESGNIFYTSKDDEKFEIIPSGTFFKNGDIIFVNPYANLTEPTVVKVSPIPIYNELNGFETINENQYFGIRGNKTSMLYLDSFDKNSSIYISENFIETILENDTKITGQFKEIEANKLYLIKNRIYSKNSISNFKKYFFPLEITTEIVIKDDEQNFLYLQNEHSFLLNFINSKMNKTIKLSSKLNSTIQINIVGIGNTYINEKNPYFKIDNNFKGKLLLNAIKDNAFIEFLSDFPTSVIRENLVYENYQMEKDSLIITVPQTQKDFVLKLISNDSLQFSLSLGKSNNKSYSYSSNLNKKIDINKNETTLVYWLYKDLEISGNEFISIKIDVDKKDYQFINISYYQNSSISELLDEKLEKEIGEQIKSNLSLLINYYIYNDIAKNPPNVYDHPNYHHRKINFTDELGKVNTSNRTFYEFAQDIQKILTTTRDLHFSVEPYLTQKGYKFYYYMTYLPFSFTIKKDNNGEQKVFIVNNTYLNKYDEETKEFITNHLDIPLKSINDIEPFNYIQNWSDYSACKNVHSQFTYMIKLIPRFYLSQFPVNYQVLNNYYEFEDNQIIKLSYGISKPTLSLTTSLNQEFDNYFLNTIIKEKHIIKPPIEEIEENFLISKGLKRKLKSLKKDKIDWNITLDEGSNTFRCRVDEDRRVNVIFQNSFHLDYQKYIGSILECGDLFYSNDYPIIIIESQNGGGYGVFMVMHQIMQMRTTNRGYFAYPFNDKAKELLKSMDWEDFDSIDVKTCEVINSFDDLIENIDYYNYNGLNIAHKRTNILDQFPLSFRKAMDRFREEHNNYSNLKKPTDIIIFTDAYSYSATSGLIKDFQNTGAGIVVGYFGNPTINGTFLFDGSQALSSVRSLEGTEIFDNLVNLGYIIGGVTFSEAFDISCEDHINEIPIEYTFGQVDERVEIYQSYSDDIYNQFIDEGLKIFEKYNNKGECNPNNTRLLLHSNDCETITDSKNAHGGYECDENGYWDTSTCHPYYCDIGYYYARDKESCIAECPLENTDSYLLYKKDYSKEFIIEKNKSYEFYTVQKDDIYYIFEASQDSIYLYPRISIIGYYEKIIVNKDKDLENNSNVNINTIEKSKYTTYETILKTASLDKTLLCDIRIVLMFKPLAKHVLYLKSLYNLPHKGMRIAELTKDMKFKDIEESNDKYFSNYDGKLYSLEENKSYIFDISYDTEVQDQFDIFINTTDKNEKNGKIKIEQTNKNYLYLHKNGNYTLNITDNITRAIKLSRNTINSEIVIEDKNNKKNTILNSKNLYYKIEDNFIGEISITVNNEDAFIEFLYKLEKSEDIEELDLENKSEFKNLTKNLNLIKIPKKYGSKNISFEINGEKGYYSVFKGYSIKDYSYYRKIQYGNEFMLYNLNFYINKPYDDNIELMDDEYYTILIELYEGSLDLKVSFPGEDNSNSDKNKGLSKWVIALIVVGGLIFILVIIIIIVKCCVIKKQPTNKEIEESFEGLVSISD